MQPDDLTTQHQFRVVISACLARAADVRSGEYVKLPSTMAHERPILHSPFSSYLERVFGWIPFNPNDEERIKAYHETFLSLAKDLEDDTEHAPLPSPAAFARLWDAVTDHHTRTIVIQGNRGSGKTACVNFFLCKSHRQMLDAGIAWFRTDVSQLYERNREATAPQITIGEYTQAHNIFVALKYGGKDPLLAAFVSSTKTWQGTEFTQWLRSTIQDASMCDRLCVLWGKLFDVYDRQAAAKNSSGMDFIERVVQFQMRPDPELFTDLYTEFVKCIRKDDQTRIVQIVDGVDNVRIGKNSQLYEKFLRELAHEFLPRQKTTLRFDKAILVLRDDTVHELSEINEAHGLPGPADASTVIDVASPDPDVLLNRKLDVASNPSSGYFRNLHQEALKGRNTEEFVRFRAAAAALYAEMTQQVSRVIGDKASQTTSPLELMFNENQRSLSRNLVRAFLYVDRHFKATSRYRSDDPGAFDLEQVEREERGRGNLLFEGSLLAGQTFMASNWNQSIRGRWCPNLFEFKETVDEPSWGGLHLLRVLQLIAAYPGRFTSTTVAHTLSLLFQYPLPRIYEAVDVAREFGLIRATNRRWPRSSDATPEPAFALTAKGDFVRLLPFKSVPVCYFMAASTLLSKQEISELSGSLLHNPTPGVQRNFLSAAIQTSALLMRHVLTQHAREMSIARSKRPKGAAKLLADVLKPLEATFALPSLDEWHRDAAALFSGISPHEREKLASALV